MNKLFLKVFMPLLFLQVMVVVSVSAQTLTNASNGDTRTTVAAPVNATITFPVNLAPAEKVLFRLTDLAKSYSLQKNALPENSPLHGIFYERILCIKKITANISKGIVLQQAVSVPFSDYCGKKTEATVVNSFKSDLEAALNKF